MAKQPAARVKQEKGMLKNIAGSDAPEPEAPAAEAPSKAAPIGWIGYAGGVLWALVFCAAGLVAWLIFAGG